LIETLPSVSAKCLAASTGAGTMQVEEVAAAGVAVAEVRHPLHAQAAPRASAMARSSAGLACSPRQATTASPAVVKAANPPSPSRPPS
jgi:hypothetical protein